MSTRGWAQAGDPVIETTLGKVRGVAQGGALAFKGIRYAIAQRFRAPTPPAPWAGIADATGFGASAPQTNPAPPPPGPPPLMLMHLPRPAGAPPPVRLPESEDCLFLNVWTGDVRPNRARPVMVWLHGGFFSGSSGSTVDGSAIAARGDAVVVSINHRLNAFGFTALPASLGAEFAQSGNAGMLDIVAALEWVRDNIAAFGGDPARVMVFGTSGGGMKTAFLMASPAARGLFHRAGIQSGPGMKFMEPDAAERATAMLLRELGAGPAGYDRLLSASQADLLGAYHRVAAALPPARFIDLPCFAPVHDGTVLPHHPFSPQAAPGVAQIPLLTGSNAQEMTFFMGRDAGGFTLDDAAAQARIAAVAGDRAEAIGTWYAASYPQLDPAQRWIRFHSDLSITVPAMILAQRMAAAGGKVWRYRLDQQSPALDGKLGATHTIETPLIFDTARGAAALLGDSPQVNTLAAEMSRVWTGFAAAGEAPWARFNGPSGTTRRFGPNGGDVTGLDAELFALLAPLVPA